MTAHIRLVAIHPGERPIGEYPSRDTSRVLRAYTIQAANSPVRGACRYCGERHYAPRCSAPVRRGWGYPGWEKETEERAALFESGSPSSDMQSRMASAADFRSSTAITFVGSNSESPSPSLTSEGTLTNPQ